MVIFGILGVEGGAAGQVVMGCFALCGLNFNICIQKLKEVVKNPKEGRDVIDR